MIKCPNCSSTALMKYLWTEYYTFSHTKEVWKCCGCGCRVERIMKEQNRIVTFPNGGIKYKERK